MACGQRQAEAGGSSISLYVCQRVRGCVGLSVRALFVSVITKEGGGSKFSIRAALDVSVRT